MSEHEIQSAIQTAVEIVTKPYQKTNNRYFTVLMCMIIPIAVFVGIDLGKWQTWKDDMSYWRNNASTQLAKHESSIQSLQDDKNEKEMEKINRINTK